MRRVHGEALRDRLLADLPPDVALMHSWIIDPDGALTLVPFEALPGADGHPLVERRSMRYVTTLTQLVKDKADPRNASPACVVANLAYTSPVGAAGQEPNGAGWRLSSGSLTRGSVTVPELADTALEADAVRASLEGMHIRVGMFEGAAATPAALLDLRASPAILHVASHAALFDTQFDRATDHTTPAFDNMSGIIVPGRRAGLVLSGTSRPSLMFASDIAPLPLGATQLAVFSGCNTGNGDIDLGEGVSSLRRSLEEAGAASTVTSAVARPESGHHRADGGILSRPGEGRAQR